MSGLGWRCWPRARRRFALLYSRPTERLVLCKLKNDGANLAPNQIDRACARLTRRMQHEKGALKLWVANLGGSKIALFNVFSNARHRQHGICQTSLYGSL